MRLLTAAAPVDQSPPDATSARRSVIRPSRPITRLARTSSCIRRSCMSASWLTRSASWPVTPVPAAARAEKSPATSAVTTPRTSARSVGPELPAPIGTGWSGNVSVDIGPPGVALRFR